MHRLIEPLLKRRADHCAVFNAFAESLAKLIQPRRPVVRVRPLGEAE